MTVVLTRTDVLASLDMATCIAAVEAAFAAEAFGRILPTAVAATHTTSGTFHVKTAGLVGNRQYFAAKINANFPRNPVLHAQPTIQGVVSLHDAETGALLALLDSASITALRTAAATAVAAKHLARVDAHSVAVAGCGAQAKSQLRALNLVRPIHRVALFDLDRTASGRLAEEMRSELACPVVPVDDFHRAALAAGIIVTCTPAREPILSAADVPAGAFVAAVGADSPDKQELAPELLADNRVVVDSLEQCASFGELHHAMDRGLMARADVHAALSEIVAGTRAGRTSDSEITIFDSTGTGLEDVAAAAAAYERAVERGWRGSIRFGA